MDTKGWEKHLPTAYVPWDVETAEEGGSWSARVEALERRLASLEKHPGVFPQFCANAFCHLVFDSNRMEGTLSHLIEEGKTIVMIREFFSGKRPEPEVVDWDAEGGHFDACNSSERQLWQCTQATKFLFGMGEDGSVSLPPLTVDHVRTTHAILMAGAVHYDKHGKFESRVPAGVIRSREGVDEVSAGWYQFLPAKFVLASLKRVLNEFEEQMLKYTTKAADALHPIDIVSQLFYEVITIHPFINGNGRLCRLLAAYAMMRVGFPFPLSMSSGHHKRRRHYLHAINRARERSSRGELNCILLVSAERALANYCINLQYVKKAEEVVPVELKEEVKAVGEKQVVEAEAE